MEDNIILIATNLKTGDSHGFNTHIECARKLRIDLGSITKVLKGSRKQAGGYTFQYKKCTDISSDELVPVPKRIRHKTKSNHIIATNIKTGESHEFTTNVECARQLELNQSSITKVLKGRLKQTGGFTFKYKEGYNG